MVGSEARALKAAVVPTWRRVTQGEPRWPVSLGILAAIALQIALPDHLAPHPRWMLPALEKVERGRTALREASGQ
jgi:hypothetical protein